MKKSILIGVSIVTVLGILLAAVALGFGNTKLNAFTEAQGYEKVNETAPPQVQENNEIPEISMEGAIQQAQSNVSFRILRPMYIPSNYKFDNAGGSRFTGVMTDIDMASFSYKSEDEQLTIKQIIVVKTRENRTQPSDLPKDTREIVNINGIEGRFSEENDVKLLGWRIGNLSLSITSWKNEGQNQTGSSLSKEEMIKIAESVREKTPDEAIAEAQEKVSFKILQPSYIPAGYRMNTAQTSGTKFRGSTLEAEQVMVPYVKGDELFEKNEYLNLKELLIIKDDTDISESVSGTPYKFIDINGVQGRFLEEAGGMKSLNWKKGNLSLTISSYAYKENNVTGTSITLEEMAKMARSVK
ncbi:MAG: DUF4367 domain-containing protein [Candidatus Methanoperedens sp.]|nr:DUF4367 domain-containing protein [Candidatus Methanoperedens sp.]